MNKLYYCVGVSVLNKVVKGATGVQVVLFAGCIKLNEHNCDLPMPITKNTEIRRKHCCQ